MKIHFNKNDINDEKINHLLTKNNSLKNQFPNKHQEDWKFTDLDKILNFNFNELKVLREKNLVNKKKIFSFDHYALILVNGNISQYDFGKGLVKFETKLYDDSTNIKLDDFNGQNLDKITFSENDLLFNYNIILSDRGFNLKFLSDIDKPLVIYNYFYGDLENSFINIYNKIEVTNSNSTIIECIIDESNSSYLKNIFQKIDLDNSDLKYFLINTEDSKSFTYSRNKIDVQKSNYKNYIFTSGLKFKKEDNELSFKSENSSADIYSASILKNKEHQEIKTVMRHAKPNCKSYQKIKNILTDSSRAVFQGKVKVLDEAQKTDAYQLSKGLILDENSEFNAKPELEIYADDVKCSHGSTSGNVDREAIYYLMTRGISEKIATKIIIKGFLSDIVSEVQNPEIKKIIENHLEKNI